MEFHHGNTSPGLPRMLRGKYLLCMDGQPSFTGWTLQDTRGFMVEKASQVHDQRADVGQLSASFPSISLCPPSEIWPQRGHFPLCLMVDQIFPPTPAEWELALGHVCNNHLSLLCGCRWGMVEWILYLQAQTPHWNVTLANVLLYMLSVLTHHSEVHALSTPYLCQHASLKPGTEDELWCRRECHGGWWVNLTSDEWAFSTCPVSESMQSHGCLESEPELVWVSVRDRAFWRPWSVGTLEKAGPLESALLEFQSQAVLLNC